MAYFLPNASLQMMKKSVYMRENNLASCLPNLHINCYIQYYGTDQVKQAFIQNRQFGPGLK